MKIETKCGIVDIDDAIHVETADVDALKARISQLERENAVLIDAATSNAVLRHNVEKMKTVTKFQRTSALMFRSASRAIWKTFSIEIGEISDDGIRPLTITSKATGEKMELFVPAERASYIERVFKPDGTFANRDDVFALIKERDALTRRFSGRLSEEDEE